MRSLIFWIFDEFMQWEQACREDQKLKIINQQSHENHFLYLTWKRGGLYSNAVAGGGSMPRRQNNNKLQTMGLDISRQRPCLSVPKRQRFSERTQDISGVECMECTLWEEKGLESIKLLTSLTQQMHEMKPRNVWPKSPNLKMFKNQNQTTIYDNKVKNIIRKQKTSWKPKIWINKQDADLNGYISILLQNHHQTNWFTNR